MKNILFLFLILISGPVFAQSSSLDLDIRGAGRANAKDRDFLSFNRVHTKQIAKNKAFEIAQILLHRSEEIVYGQREAPRIIHCAPHVRGFLGRKIIKNVLRRQKKIYKSCYENELQVSPKFIAKVVLRFSFSRQEGIVRQVDVSGTKNKRFKKCLEKTTAKLVFPASTTFPGIVRITYPLFFKRKESAKKSKATY